MPNAQEEYKVCLKKIFFLISKKKEFLILSFWKYQAPHGKFGNVDIFTFHFIPIMILMKSKFEKKISYRYLLINMLKDAKQLFNCDCFFAYKRFYCQCHYYYYYSVNAKEVQINPLKWKFSRQLLRTIRLHFCKSFCFHSTNGWMNG